ncbi:hypothetical protein Tco_0498771 [Tanacetum coccineum]
MPPSITNHPVLDLTMVGTTMLGGGGEWCWGIKNIGGWVGDGGSGWWWHRWLVVVVGEVGHLRRRLVVMGGLMEATVIRGVGMVAGVGDSEVQLHPHYHDQPKKVDSLGDHDSEDEVALVDNEMANFMASNKVGYGTNYLLEHW